MRLDDGHRDAPGCQLEPERVGQRFEGELGGGVSAREGRGHAPRDRSHVNDAARARPDERQEGLRHRDLADHVDLELAPQVGKRKKLDRPRHDDAGIVDEPRQSRRADDAGDRAGRGGNRQRVRDFERDRSESRRALRLEGLGVGLPADPGEDSPAEAVEVERARRADARRRARDHHRPGGRRAQRASESRFAATPPTIAATAVIAKATMVGPRSGAIGARAGAWAMRQPATMKRRST